MRFLSITVKILKETFRDKKGLAFLLLFPIAFMFVFGFAFSAGFSENTPYEIAVLNQDQGTVFYYNGTPNAVNYGDQFTQLLEDLKYEDSDVNLFKIHYVSEQKANDMLMDREVACVITIPANFSVAMESMINETVRSTIFSYFGEIIIKENETEWNMTGFTYPSIPMVDENTTCVVLIEGDTGYINFGITQSILQGVLSDYLEEVKSQAKESVLSTLPEGSGEPSSDLTDDYVSTNVKGIFGTENFTTFDHQAPGIIIFALLLLSINVATTLSREVETKKLTRLKITKMNSFDLLFGTLIPWALIAIVQVLLLFLVAIGMGYHWQGGPIGIGLAILIGSIAGISSVSLGLIIASFSKSEKHASNLGTLIAVPMSFLVGAFFEVPTKFFTYALPWGQAVSGLRDVLTFGQGFGDVALTMVILTIQTAVLFIIGVVAFAKTQLKAE